MMIVKKCHCPYKFWTLIKKLQFSSSSLAALSCNHLKRGIERSCLCIAAFKHVIQGDIFPAMAVRVEFWP